MNTRTPRYFAGITLATTIAASAVTVYDTDVTGAVIFGTSGNANGSFTVSRDETPGLEIGLRAKQRWPTPAGVYNSNGDGTYTFPAGAATILPASSWWNDATLNTPGWNFEWSINTNYDTNGGNIGTGTFAFLSLDIDPSAGTNFQTFEILQGDEHHIPLRPAWDHSFGNNSTLNNEGLEAADPDKAADYDILIAHNNLVQNSWNYEFFDSTADFYGEANPLLASFVPVNGEYEVKLELWDSISGSSPSGNYLGSNSITVVMIPEPTLALGGLLCLAGLGIRRRAR